MIGPYKSPNSATALTSTFDRSVSDPYVGSAVLAGRPLKLLPSRGQPLCGLPRRSRARAGPSSRRRTALAAEHDAAQSPSKGPLRTPTSRARCTLLSATRRKLCGGQHRPRSIVTLFSHLAGSIAHVREPTALPRHRNRADGRMTFTARSDQGSRRRRRGAPPLSGSSDNQRHDHVLRVSATTAPRGRHGCTSGGRLQAKLHAVKARLHGAACTILADGGLRQALPAQRGER